MTLISENLRPGSRVLIDTTVLLRGVTGFSKRCEQLLGHCRAGRLKGILPLPVLGELSHQLMVLEARRHGKALQSNPARWLAKHPEAVKGLNQTRAMVKDLLEANFEIVAATGADHLHALKIQEGLGLLSSDSIIAAMALRCQADCIASLDAAFQRLSGMGHYAPKDSIQ